MIMKQSSFQLLTLNALSAHVWLPKSLVFESVFGFVQDKVSLTHSV